MNNMGMNMLAYAIANATPMTRRPQHRDLAHARINLMRHLPNNLP